MALATVTITVDPLKAGASRRTVSGIVIVVAG
jgi:hypothetical protein